MKFTDKKITLNKNYLNVSDNRHIRVAIDILVIDY